VKSCKGWVKQFMARAVRLSKKLISIPGRSPRANLADKKKLKGKILAMLFPFYGIAQVGISECNMIS
jgi:hypothetical protein